MKFPLLTIILFGMYLLGYYYFSKGFLLTRLELDAKATCNGPCPYSPQFKKAVIILIDALRFDFAFYNESSPDEHYRNKLPIFHELTTHSPQQAMLFQAIADPPTTTLQRLKALTTGTLPTFVDAGSNFGGLIVAEDNLVHQLKQAGRKVWFMGDDTWMGLFPDAFDKSFPISFV